MRWTIVFCPSVVEKGRLHHCTMKHGVHKYSAGGGSMSIGTRCYDDFWEVKKGNRFWRILVRTIAISTKFPGSAAPVLSSVSNQLQADHRPESIIKCGTGMPVDYHIFPCGRVLCRGECAGQIYQKLIKRLVWSTEIAIECWIMKEFPSNEISRVSTTFWSRDYILSCHDYLEVSQAIKVVKYEWSDRLYWTWCQWQRKYRREVYLVGEKKKGNPTPLVVLLLFWAGPRGTQEVVPNWYRINRSIDRLWCSPNHQ